MLHEAIEERFLAEWLHTEPKLNHPRNFLDLQKVLCSEKVVLDLKNGSSKKFSVNGHFGLGKPIFVFLRVEYFRSGINSELFLLQIPD